MLERMAFPSARALPACKGATASCKTVVGEHARPHDVGARIVVIGVRQRARRLVHQRADEPARDVVGHGHGAHAAEEALADVRDHVGHARSRLIRGKRERDLRIHERDERTEEGAVHAVLRPELIVADDARIRGFRTGGRDGEHRGHGQGGSDLRLLAEEIPDVALVRNAERDGLRRIDDAAASDGEHDVDLGFPRDADSLAHECDLGVRARSALLDHGDARRSELRAHAVEDAGPFGRTAAVHDERMRESALS